MALTTYSYPVTSLPGGAVNLGRLVNTEIPASDIATALDPTTNVLEGTLNLVFKAELPPSDKTLLDGGLTQDPEDPPLAGSVLAEHDSTATPTKTRQVQVSNSPSVHIRKPSGLTNGRVYGFSVNFCDKTTWWHEAEEVVNQSLGTGDGTTTTFNMPHGVGNDPDERILDLCHGKVSDENHLANPRGEFRGYGQGYVDGATDPTGAVAPLSGYVPIVYLDGVEQTERSFAGTDGDYEIDYEAGTVTFYTPPTNGAAVTATYWRVPPAAKAYTLVVPIAGSRYMIDRVEIQSSPDACFVCDLLMNVYAGAAWPSGNPMERPTVIKKVSDIVNWAYGARAQIPAQGGETNPRRLAHAVNIHQVRYTSEIPLLSSAAMYMQVNTATGKPFDGTWATVVIYGIEEPEGT